MIGSGIPISHKRSERMVSYPSCLSGEITKLEGQWFPVSA